MYSRKEASEMEPACGSPCFRMGKFCDARGVG
jgi:hypothetical protein